MNNIELVLISIGLAMDAFSVSICKGLTMKYKWRRNIFLIAFSFSFFSNANAFNWLFFRL